MTRHDEHGGASTEAPAAASSPAFAMARPTPLVSYGRVHSSRKRRRLAEAAAYQAAASRGRFTIFIFRPCFSRIDDWQSGHFRSAFRCSRIQRPPTPARSYGRATTRMPPSLQSRAPRQLPPCRQRSRGPPHYASLRIESRTTAQAGMADITCRASTYGRY